MQDSIWMLLLLNPPQTMQQLKGRKTTHCNWMLMPTMVIVTRLDCSELARTWQNEQAWRNTQPVSTMQRTLQ